MKEAKLGMSKIQGQDKVNGRDILDVESRNQKWKSKKSKSGKT